MQKVMIGIFAHPDDEAFGPSGTLLKLESEGWHIHLISLTDGDAGVNIDNVDDLAAVRNAEWQKSASILGAVSTAALHYPDGKLNTIKPGELIAAVRDIVAKELDEYDEPTEISYMTLEPNGLTGHHDHIAASRLTTKLAEQHGGATVWYFCLDQSQAPLGGTAYYEPRARDDDYITDKIDISPWLNDKHRMMDAHLSQRNDAATMKKLNHTIENFHIETY